MQNGRPTNRTGHADFARATRSETLAATAALADIIIRKPHEPERVRAEAKFGMMCMASLDNYRCQRLRTPSMSSNDRTHYERVSAQNQQRINENTTHALTVMGAVTFLRNVEANQALAGKSDPISTAAIAKLCAFLQAEYRIREFDFPIRHSEQPSWLRNYARDHEIAELDQSEHKEANQ